MKKINPIPFKGMLSMSRMAFMATLVMLVATFSSQAQTQWFVNDATAENGWAVGNNTNSGLSESAPKLTIQAAITAAAPGDIIHVGVGTFVNNFSVTKSLTIRGINYQQSGPTRGPTASDESVITGARAVISINANNVTIEGFRFVPTSSRFFENPIGTGLSLLNNVFIVNGNRNPTYGIFDARMNNISGLNISGNLFQCTSGTGGFTPIYLVRSTGNLIADNAIISQNAFVNTAHGIHMDRAGFGSMNNVTITQNTFNNIQGVSTGSTGGGRAITANGLSYSNIGSNTFNNVYYYGIQLGSSNDVSIAYNNFTGNGINGLRVVTSMSNIEVNSNNFDGNFTQKAIVNAVGSGSLNATCNWLGSNNSANVTNAVSATGAGTVTVSPWLINNVDDNNVSPGFQPAPNTCTGGSSNPLTIVSLLPDEIYCSETGAVEVEFDGGVGPFTISWPGGSESNVTSPFIIPALAPGEHTITISDANTSVSQNVTLVAKKVYNASWGIAYTSLQAAIDAASPGDVITLCSGTYAEKITLGKSLTILGPNANISPNTDGTPSAVNAGRYEEAIIMPSQTSGALLTASASNISVVMKGIVFDRGNGTAGDARFVDQINKTGNSWVLENNIFQNAPQTTNGYFYMTGTVTGMSFSFNNNRLTNNGISNGIALWGTSLHNVSLNNNVWYNNYGWSFNVNSVAGTINNNYFVEDRPGAVDSIWYKVQSGFIVANADNNVTVSGNVFSNLRHGINLYRGDAGANNHFRGAMSISNNTFNTLHVYAIRGSKGAYSPDLTNVTITNNSFLNAQLQNDTNSFVMNASCNWFGSLNAQTIASNISGNVSYSPWLVNGTDEDPAMGFQPGANLCTGTAPVISSLTQTAPALCLNTVGVISASFTDGSAPYSITLNAGTPEAGVASPYSFDSLAAGTYTVTISDANGSTVSSTVVVNELPVVVKKSDLSLTGYSTISAAISNANTSNGDTIFVCPGTISNTYFNVTKSLTIKGGQFSISGSANTRGTNETVMENARFEISANNVTIDGFTFVNGHNRLSETSGIYVHGSRTGLNIINNVFTRSGAFGSARAIVTGYNSPTELNIANNLFTDAGNGTGNGWSSGMYLNPGTYGSISNNVFEGLNVSMSVETPSAALTISNNTFKGSEFEAIGFNHVGSLVSLSGNTFDADNNFYMSAYNWGTGIGNAINATDNTFGGTLASSLTKAQLFAVEDKIQHGVDATSPSNPLTGLIRIKANQVYVTSTSGSINRGITAASVGDTVNVSAETYAQNILVNKSVYLHGANAGTAGNGSRDTETKILDGQLTVSGTGAVVVDGFDFYQTTANYAGTISLTTGNTPVTIQNNIIERWATATGSTVRGIETSLTTAPISITNNLFRGDISGSLYSGHKTWNSGIYSNGGNISITSNEFTNCRTAINCDDMSNNVVINNNTFGTNGTAISFGGVNPTEGSYTISGNNFNTALAIINLSNVNANFRLDATSNNYNGIAAANLTLVEAFAVENQMYHKGRSSKNGLVRVKAGNMFNTLSTTVANNISYSNAGDTLHIDNGAYAGNFTINKKLNIIGQGNNTVIRSSGNTAITYAAAGSGANSTDRAYLQNLRVASSNKGILASEVVNYLTLSNVTIDSSTTYGIHVNNVSGVMKDWALSGCSFNANGSGYYGATASNIDTISFTNCSFTNQVNSGLYVGQSSSTPGAMNNVTITGCTFENNGINSNNQAAMYIEKMSNATITNNTITNNGLVSTNPRNIIMNLKYASFSNISITGNTIIENRATPSGGYGIQVAARNDAPSYNTLPASVSNLVISNNNVQGHLRGITIDNNVDWNTTTIQNNAISDCHYGLLSTVYPIGVNTVNQTSTMTISNNSFINCDTILVNANINGGTFAATCNWFGTTEQQSFLTKIASLPNAISFSPWLSNGTDNDAVATGFQTTALCDRYLLELTMNSLDTVIFCKDETSAYVDFSIDGGVLPYTIDLDGISYSSSDDFYVNDTIGTAGLHNLTITDANGSIVSYSFTVLEPNDSLIISATPIHPVCSSDLGSIVLSATGGTSPLSVDINGAVYGANQTVSVDPGDTYAVIVTDDNGCIAETEVTINAAPDPLEFDASTVSTDALCADLNGKIEFLATGGTGAINYTVDGVPATSPMLMPAATYTIVATDANSCSISTALIIDQPLGISIVVSNVENPNCFQYDGSFNLRGVGGTSIDSTGFTYTVNGDNYDFSDKYYAPNGSYTVVVTDAVNTVCSVSTIVTLTEPALLEVNTTITDVSCFGGSGVLDYTVSGGTAPYSIDINGGVYTSATDVLSKPAGNYTISVVDANGCTIDPPVEVTINQPLSVLEFSTAVSISPDCFGQAGSIEFVAEGGTGNIVYTINNNTVSSPFTAVAGTYTVTATDENGCITVTDILLEAPTQVVFTPVTITNLDCFNDADGSIEFEASGGTGGISYTVNTLADASPLQSLIAGVYTIVASDENGCTAETTAEVTQPDDIVITADVTNPSCNSANGSVAFTATGGNGSYSFTVGNNAASPSFAGASGTYTVNATDAKQCAVSTTFTITEPSAVVLTASKTDAPCKNGDGSLEFSATGGAGGYTYTVNSTSQTSPMNTVAGSYTIIATDATNCSASTVLEISEPDLLELTASTTDAACFGANGSLIFSAVGGTSPYTFKYGNDTIASPYQTGAGSYTVTVIDAQGCSTSNTTLVIGQPTALSFGTPAVTNALCYGGNGQLTYEVTGGTSPINYTVNGIAATSPTDNVAGTYTVIATDANSCSISTEMTITQPDLIVLTATKTDAPCKSENGSLIFSATGGTSTLSYTVNGNAQASPFSTVAGTYTIEVTDGNSCSKDTVITVSEPDLLTLTSGVNHAACYGAEGSITFSANGGTANYAYTVNSTSASSPYSVLAGTYTILVTDANNCSTSTEVVVNQPNLITTSESASACYSYTWPVNNQTYTVSGVYADTVTAIGGCDSVVTLNLTITPYNFDTTNHVSYLTYNWRGNTYTVTGQYVDTAGINGSPACTVYVLNLTITTCIEPVLGTPVPGLQSALISWTMPQNATAPNYAVQFALAGTNNWSTSQTTSNLSFNFTGLTSNTAYNYRVRALCGTNSVSEWVNGSFTTGIITCATPVFNPSVASLNTATVSWTNTGAGSYILGWKAQSASTWNTTTIIGTQAANLNSLIAGTTYDVKVFGFCLNEVYSDTAYTTFTTTAPCGNITYTSNVPGRTTIRVDWAAVAGATGYTTQRRGPNDNTFISSAITTNLNRTFTGLTANTTYTIRVRANCPNGNTGAFNEIVITTSAAKNVDEMQTAYIVNFAGETNAEGNNLTWSTATENNCKEMVLQHSTNGSDYADIARVQSISDGGNSEEELNYGYLHKDAPFGVNYYRLKTMNYDGERAYHKDIVTLTKEVPAANVRIYPNPTKDLLNLNFNAANQGQVTVKVMDMTGRVMKVVQVQVNQGENLMALGIGEFPQGIYTIQMIQDNQLLHVSKVYRKD